jgi:coenzyme PQQ biosynthesis protein PqqD
VIAAQTRLRLARKVRLRVDPLSGKSMLLYPERGLELSETAARIARLCTEERTVAAIVDGLVELYGAEPRAVIEAEVLTFLRALEDRGLLVVDAP